jgi:hypothetical protein
LFITFRTTFQIWVCKSNNKNLGPENTQPKEKYITI